MRKQAPDFARQGHLVRSGGCGIGIDALSNGCLLVFLQMGGEQEYGHSGYARF